jgi:SAM-dependent methyltransferase
MGVRPLPVPHPQQSIISDGRVLSVPLRKAHCDCCGLVSHLAEPTFDGVRAFYGNEYDLGVVPTSDDLNRAAAYADVVFREAQSLRPSNVLEVGCGAGHVLRFLAERWCDAHFLGLEAAPQLSGRTAGSRIRVENLYVEDLTGSDRTYDLIYAVNVVEHASDPCRFLKALRDLLSPDGRIVLVCPAEQPNLELLFFDHVHTFSVRAFSRLSGAADLRILRAAAMSPAPSDFQIFVLGKATRQTPKVGPEDTPLMTELGHRRFRYLETWGDLDEVLADRLGPGPCLAFGAGEAATLIRAYAPRSWTRISGVVLDQPAGARRLDKPVSGFAELDPRSAAPILLATHPRSQATLAARLTDQGFRIVRWDDMIDR